MKKKTYLPEHSATRTFDARGKVLGRIATQIAIALMGKDKPTFAPHRIEGDLVVVLNASEVAVTGKKLDQKVYRTHSGYLGSLREYTLKKLMTEKPEYVLEMAIYNMLPKNRLRQELMRRLTIHRNEAPAERTKTKEHSA
jgi:large subunit ribosomal protein L13